MNIVGWPFSITVEGNVEQGTPATLTVDCFTPLTEERFAILSYAVESFIDLAAVGGLGGDRVPPSQSSIGMSDPAQGGTGATRVVWNLSVLAIDVRGLCVLCNALSFLASDVMHVMVQAQGEGPAAPFAVEDLPPAWPGVPFNLEDDRTGPSVELHVEFATPTPDSELEVVTEALQRWLDCGSIQGYRDWTERAERSFLAPTADPAFEINGGEVSATLEDSGVLDGCYDILVNVLIKLSDILPISDVELA